MAWVEWLAIGASILAVLGWIEAVRMAKWAIALEGELDAAVDVIACEYGLTPTEARRRLAIKQSCDHEQRPA